MSTFYKKGPSFRWMRLLSLLLLLPLAGRAQITGTSASTTVVISQIYGGGGNASASFTNDFIELHNISAVSQVLSNYSVQYASATGTAAYAVTALPASVTIPAGGYYLIQEASGGVLGSALPLPTADATGTINMSATAGKVALVSSTTALSGACPAAATVVDFVGFGSANCFEGTVAGSSSGNAFSIIRLASSGTATTGCKETNNNGADFTTASPPTPRNSASAAVSCAVATPAPTITSFTPTSGPVGTTVTVTGTDFTGATAVTLNGAAVTYTVVSATSIDRKSTRLNSSHPVSSRMPSSA